MKVKGPDYSGYVIKFDRTYIDYDPQHEVIVLTIETIPDDEDPIASNCVLYIDVTQNYAAACAGAASLAWSHGRDAYVDVYLDSRHRANLGNTGDGQRVCAVIYRNVIEVSK